LPHHNILIHDLMKPVSWGAFDRSVDRHGANKGVRTLNAKHHFVALLVAQFSGATSLREIEAAMASHARALYHLGVSAPKRSTLADANSSRPAAVFVEVFEQVLKTASRGLRKKTKEAVRLVDSTSVRLSGISADWASYEAHHASAKLHMVYDPDAETPVHFAVSPQRDSDINAAKAMPIESDATYVFDLGYYDFAWWAKLDQKGCRFVTRLKSNTRPTVVEERELPADVLARGRILADRTIRFDGRLKGTRTHPLSSKPLREIHVLIDTGKKLRIVSNDLASPAETIADLYKTRWRIELFFRWTKQNLKIKKFMGTSENAVRIQLTIAMIAYLLLKIAQAKQTVVRSPLTFSRLVRANLMHRRTIADIVAPPPTPPPPPLQLHLGLQPCAS
jgi:Transposase DDE domain/Domain of unknown function (DUF4372)